MIWFWHDERGWYWGDPDLGAIGGGPYESYERLIHRYKLHCDLWQQIVDDTVKGEIAGDNDD
jgi:hypothetical protein